jgi:hypothetical protein
MTGVLGALLASCAASGGGCSQATAFLARTSGLSSNYQTQYTSLICGLASDGVFAKLDVLYVFATADTTTAKLNLIQNSFNATAPNGDPTFAAQVGYTNPSNHYLNSNFNPTTATSPQYVQNSACLFNWNSNSADDGAAEEMGLLSGGGNSIFDRSSGNLVVKLNSSTNVVTANSDGSGLWLVNRTSSSNVDIYHNGSSFAAGNSNTSAAVPNSTITCFVGSTFNTTATFKAAGFGGALTATDITNLYNRLNTFMANIP